MFFCSCFTCFSSHVQAGLLRVTSVLSCTFFCCFARLRAKAAAHMIPPMWRTFHYCLTAVCSLGNLSNQSFAKRAPHWALMNVSKHQREQHRWGTHWLEVCCLRPQRRRLTLRVSFLQSQRSRLNDTARLHRYLISCLCLHKDTWGSSLRFKCIILFLLKVETTVLCHKSFLKFLFLFFFNCRKTESLRLKKICICPSP